MNDIFFCLSVGHLGDFSIKVGFNFLKGQNRYESSYETCVRVTTDLAPGEALRAICEPSITGRFVMVVSEKAEATNLAICEIEVYSSKGN